MTGAVQYSEGLLRTAQLVVSEALLIEPSIDRADRIAATAPLQQRLHLGPGESEQPAESVGECVVDHGIVNSVEFAISEIPLTCDDGVLEMIIVFQNHPEGVIEESSDLLLPVPTGCGDQRVVVIVYQDYRLLSVMVFDHLGEIDDGPLDEDTILGTSEDGSASILKDFIELLGTLQFRESFIDIRHHVPERIHKTTEGSSIEIPEVHPDDVVGVLVGILRTLLGDPQTFEGVRFPGVPDVDVRVQHAEVHRLPVPVGTDDQIHLRMVLQDPVYEHGFVHIQQTPAPQGPEIAATDWHRIHDCFPRFHIRYRQY